MIRRLFFVLFILLSSSALLGVKLEFIEKFKLPEDEIILQVPASFFVAEDGLLFICDFKAGDFKIYSPGGKYINSWAKKGTGPNEFLRPLYLGYHKPYLAVMDWGHRHLFIYKRSGKTSMEFVKKTPCPALGYDICLKGNELLVSGYKADKDGNPFELYMSNIHNNEETFLLPAWEKYDMESDSPEEYLKISRNNVETSAIGTFGYCDWNGDDVYFVWEGNLKIFKINLKTNNISSFGKTTKNYIRPVATKKMLNAYRQRNSKGLRFEKLKTTYINRIFADKDVVGLWYSRYTDDQSECKLFFQFYTPDGRFLDEILLPESVEHPPIFYFKKDERILYFLKQETHNVEEGEYIMAKYKVVL